MSIKLFPSILLICAFSSAAFAQVEDIYRPDPAKVKIIMNGKEKTLAWAGGINIPQFASVDMNRDGLTDILVFEKDIKRVKTFINHGTKGHPIYKYEPAYEANIPIITNYMLIENMNPDADQIPDLFNYGGAGTGLCLGYINAQNQLAFKESDEIRYINKLGFPTNIGVGNGSLPSIVDVDHDGDLDIINYADDGSGIINMYKNFSKEAGQADINHKFKWWDRCWGKYLNYEAQRTRILGFTCNNDIIRKKTNDGIHNLTLIDMDGDGDYDALESRNNSMDMQLVINGIANVHSTEDSMINQDTLWQAGGTQVPNNFKFPAAFYVDADGDGVRDIIVSPQSQSENCKVAAYYRNTGTEKSPSFVFQQNDFLAEDMLDLGERSFPTFYDFNKDGLQDLFLCSRGATNSSGVTVPHIYYFKNTTKNKEVSFTLENDDFLQVHNFSSVPSGMTFGDMNSDGKDDFILGLVNGEMMFYANVAPRADIEPAFTTPIKLVDNTSSVINVTGEAAPVLFDVNKDGRKDLVIGNLYGTLVYYRNVSTAPNVVTLQHVTDSLGKVSVHDIYGSGSSYPYMGRINNTKDEYILVGRFDNSEIGAQRQSSMVSRYKLTGSDDANAVYPLLDSSYSKIMPHGFYSTPAVADIDNDGMMEMVVGNDKGGFHFYSQVWSVGVKDAEKMLQSLHIYPNPAKDKLVISFEGAAVTEKTIVRVFNTTGQMLMTDEISNGNSTHTLDISGLPQGVYQCNIISGSSSKSSTFVKQ